MQFVPIAVLLLGVPVVIVAMLAYDDLALLEKTRYPAAWEADGRPIPMIRGRFRSRGSFAGWIAMLRCSFTWLFRTPGWASADPEAWATLRRMRVSAALWNLVVVPIFAVAAILSAVSMR